MADSEIKKRIDELREVLRENSRKYYVDNAPSMSDFDFDVLMRELEDLENAHPEFKSPDSPTQKVGSDLEIQGTGHFIQREHRYPMLSLANTYSIAEIEEFSARADKTIESSFSYCCELKFDGTSICLTYRNGKLFRALTRGDGIKGDDVTQNVRHISNVPQELVGDFPDDLEIRGEVLMPYEAFDALNAQRIAAEEEPFANPRNAASGSLKLINPEEVGKRGLWCTLYHIPAQSITFETHDEALKSAQRWGLPVSEHRRICRNIGEIEEYINFWDTQRKFLPFATDGIVIKINELDCQRTLGYTAKSPRWAVAYKFKAEQAQTKVLSIDYQVGRTGAITPVANLEPVQLSGSVVKRATLNNEDWMKQLDVRVGDVVYVEKGGEIIPKICGVNADARSCSLKPTQFPSICPDCGTPLRREEDEAKWFCPNRDGCPMQIKGELIHFASRKAMNILAGDATVDQLYDLGFVKTPADLYDLKKYQLLSLEGWKDKSAQRFLDSLEESKKVGFERVLFALGIRMVGETTAKDLARHYKNIDSLIAANSEELCAVPNVGMTIAQSIVEYFSDPRHVLEIERLKAHGLSFDMEASSGAKSDALAGKIIVVSGTFSVSRDEIKLLIEKHGGKNSGSVSSKTSFLLAGEKPGPEKIAKCSELGIEIVSEDTFMKMIPESETVKEKFEELSLF